MLLTVYDLMGSLAGDLVDPGDLRNLDALCLEGEHMLTTYVSHWILAFVVSLGIWIVVLGYIPAESHDLLLFRGYHFVKMFLGKVVFRAFFDYSMA